MKRLLRALAALLIALTATATATTLPGPALADGLLAAESPSTGAGEVRLHATQARQDVKDALLAGINGLADTVDLERFGASLDEVWAAMYTVKDEHPDLFFFENATLWHVDGTVVYAELHYLTQDRAELSSMRARFDAAMSEALSWTSATMTDLQNAKALHDYLVRNTVYDYKNYANNTIPPESYNAYGPLVLRTGVCQGYSEAYAALLERVGIESTITSSDAMNHAWNIVTIGGRNYHVDVTWDDPVSFSTGLDGGFYDDVRDDYFMISDAAMLSRKHYGWDSALSCDDRSLDNRQWETYDRAVRTPYAFSDVTWSDWFVREGVLEWVVDNGVMSGFDARTFGPGHKITRAQLVTMLWRLIDPGERYSSSSGLLPDIPAGAYYTEAANWAVGEGVIRADRFDADKNLSREELVVILMRAGVASSGTIQGYTPEGQREFSAFPDGSQTSDWARTDVVSALSLDILNGSGGRLYPQAECTRAEAAAMLKRAVDADVF